MNIKQIFSTPVEPRLIKKFDRIEAQFLESEDEDWEKEYQEQHGEAALEAYKAAERTAV